MEGNVRMILWIFFCSRVSYCQRSARSEGESEEMSIAELKTAHFFQKLSQKMQLKCICVLLC